MGFVQFWYYYIQYIIFYIIACKAHFQQFNSLCEVSNILDTYPLSLAYPLSLVTNCILNLYRCLMIFMLSIIVIMIIT